MQIKFLVFGLIAVGIASMSSCTPMAFGAAAQIIPMMMDSCY